MKKILIIPLFILILGGCSNQNAKIDEQNKKIDELNNKVTELTASNSKSDLDLQAKCATQAQKAFEDFKKSYADSQYYSYAQESHYNKTYDRCFVLVSYLVNSGPVYNGKPFRQATNGEDLLDAYGNRDLASCEIFGNDIPNNQTCIVEGNGATYKDYTDYVVPRLELPPQK